MDYEIFNLKQENRNLRDKLSSMENSYCVAREKMHADYTVSERAARPPQYSIVMSNKRADADTDKAAEIAPRVTPSCGTGLARVLATEAHLGLPTVQASSTWVDQNLNRK